MEIILQPCSSPAGNPLWFILQYLVINHKLANDRHVPLFKAEFGRVMLFKTGKQSRHTRLDEALEDSE
jgi:hypothetical protein